MRILFIIVVAGCCLSGILAQSQCEEHRERELKSKSEVKLVPKCDKNGDYEDLQCFENSKFCMCWRPDGSHITDPSKNVKTCACHVHRDQELVRVEKGLDNFFMPRCNDDGTYARVQCPDDSGYCWCSDEDGNKISEEVKGEPDC